MHEIFPEFSKKRVTRAGDAIRKGVESEEDLAVVANWRAAHGLVLNTFRQTLNRHSKGYKVTVAQRLKRKNTIFDKLKRQPSMQLARMHDIAGCRLIFPDMATLQEFRLKIHNSQFKHELFRSYDYVLKPKITGYRGIHDVYEYQSYSGSVDRRRWNGLKIEIQYRTEIQHSWATAVEIFDEIHKSRLKFGETEDDTTAYFQVYSELLHWGLEASQEQLDVARATAFLRFYIKSKKFHHIHSQILGLAQVARPAIELGVDGFVVIRRTPDENVKVAFPSDSKLSTAISLYFEVESEFPDDNVVLVRSSSSEATAHSFQNYFSNITNFTNFASHAVPMLFRNIAKKQKIEIPSDLDRFFEQLAHENKSGEQNEQSSILNDSEQKNEIISALRQILTAASPQL